MGALYEPTSPEYKKARKQYYKSVRNRPHEDPNWTPFRAAEKHFKARFPPPDLSNVLDLATLDPSREAEIKTGGWRGNCAIEGIQHTQLKQARSRAFVVPHIPGLVVLPSYVCHERQKELIRWAIAEHAKPPTETNLDIHHAIPEQGVWEAWLQSRDDPSQDPMAIPKAVVGSPPGEPSGPRQLINNEPASPASYTALAHADKIPQAPSPTVKPVPTSTLLHKLRWANLGWFYHWGTKQYDFAKGPDAIDPRVRTLCRDAVHSVDWSEVFDGCEGDWGEEGADWKTWSDTYEPDAGIVNFYQTKDTLMGHVDRSEVCATSPLVSISLGNAAVFLIGGTTRESPPTALLLRSGDVVIMSGPACRRAYHGVPRILEDTLPPHLRNEDDPGWGAFQEYMNATRINVNVRQVFPKGFDPGKELSKGPVSEAQCNTDIYYTEPIQARETG
ncbi:hypothetical protein BD626DRAFT_411772 [Schizophyllum amplum]|uniref:Fe2OG dioxygenase domain-containing protein n=1 Tax=Schizophyllum amplum TaxID=97359 RepID=A0A550BYB8_9AGAR|nr:hypothetical protein BD626DRAFT_411772 [Auriculariopsis ampla]